MAAGCVVVSPALYIVFLLLYICPPRLNDSIHFRKQKGLKSSTFCTINHGFRGSVVTLLLLLELDTEQDRRSNVRSDE